MWRSWPTTPATAPLHRSAVGRRRPRGARRPRPRRGSPGRQERPLRLQRRRLAPREPVAPKTSTAAGRGHGGVARRVAPRQAPGPAPPDPTRPRQSSPPARISSHRGEVRLGLCRPLVGEEPGQARAGTSSEGTWGPWQAPGRGAAPARHGALAVPQGTPGRRPASAGSAPRRAGHRPPRRRPPPGPRRLGLLPRPVEEQQHPARPGLAAAVRRLVGPVDLAHRRQGQHELVDHGVVGVGEGGEPGLAQAAPAPRPCGAGVEQVGVGQQRGARSPASSPGRVGHLVGRAPSPLPGRRGVGEAPLVRGGPAPRPAGDHREVPSAEVGGDRLGPVRRLPRAGSCAARAWPPGTGRGAGGRRSRVSAAGARRRRSAPAHGGCP